MTIKIRLKRRRNKPLVFWENNGFNVKIGDATLIKGYIDSKRIEKIPLNFITKTEELFGSPLEEKNQVISIVNKEDLANFLFIRSILDFGGVAPSNIFAMRMLELYQQKRYLFNPKDEIWSKLQQYPSSMLIVLLPIAGLFRTDFTLISRWWRGIIQFLNKECNGNASNFFDKMTEKLRIDKTKPEALESLHEDLLNKKIRLSFPYGEKNGRFMFTVMTQSRRGYNVIEGIYPEHLKHFDLPVDTQIIRVGLNSGIIRLEDVISDQLTMLKKEGHALPMGPYLSEICKKAWKLVANEIGLIPAELDWYVWSIGANICKRFGDMCFICPLISMCGSVENMYVKESRGVDWYRGCFSMARPHPTAFGIVRTCKDCPDFKNQNKCSRGDNYKTHTISSEEMNFVNKLIKTGLD